ncbi:hypothetical protein HDU83_008101 [Entophlyctis luteolus]|nr:hypothetical protein HDU83_008101 [Entophlyctis luteolus]
MNSTTDAQKAAIAALSSALNSAQQAELPYLSASQLELLLHAPPRVLSNSQLLTVLLYIYSIGGFLCGAIVIAALADPKRLLKTTTDRLTMGLVATCFVWSAGRSVIETLEGLGILRLSNGGAAAFSNIMTQLLAVINCHLAMERYFLVKDHPRNKYLIIGLWSLFGISVVLMICDGLKPDDRLQQTVWLLLLCSQYLVTSVSMAWLYLRTYRHSARELADNPEIAEFFLKRDGDNSKDPQILSRMRLKVEKEVLVKCLLLSTVVMVEYAPFLAYEIQSCLDGPIPFFDLSGLYYIIALVLVSLDVITTPLLVFFFNREIRSAFKFWKK